jgi:hypothetical protein
LLPHLVTAGAALLLSGAGCQRDQGYTDCSGILCQPGQYCFAPGVCESGCTSDVNCAEGQDCTDEGEGFDGEGVCRDGDDAPPPGEGEGEPPGDPLAACGAACEFFQGCGASANDTLGCRNDCPDLSENQQLVVAGCAEGSCGEALTCLDIDCFNDGDCGVGEECLGNACL